MAFLEWSDDYKCNIASIDDDHRMLFHIVNALHDDIANKAVHKQVASTITALIDYVELHFSREEKQLANHGYPGLEAHKRLHKALKDRVYAIKHLYDTDPSHLDIDKVLDFLKDWLVNHIVTNDFKYVPYLKGQARRGAGAAGTVSVTVPPEKIPLIHTCAEVLMEGGRVSRALEEVLVKIQENKAPEYSKATEAEFLKTAD